MALLQNNKYVLRTKISTIHSGYTYYDLYRSSQGWRFKPFVEGVLPPLPYTMIYSQLIEEKPVRNPNGKPWEICGCTSFWHYNRLSGDMTLVLNRAYGKLIGKLRGDSAELGATLAEGRQALSAVADRAKFLLDSYRLLRKGHFIEFLNKLSIRPKRKHARTVWSLPKDASSLWLEYWFGWAPLVADIYNSIEVLNKDFTPWISIKEKSGMPVQSNYLNVNSTQKWTEEMNGRLGCTIGAEFRLVNPNAALLSQLGIANPVSVMWELVPFSFLVDWFYNIGDYLNSYTDTMGYEIRNPYYTTYQVQETTRIATYIENPPGGIGWKGLTCTNRYREVHMSRVCQFWRPVPTLNFPKRLSVTRALTSISLLTSIFTKG